MPSRNIRVAFFGYHNAGVKCLDHLLRSGAEIVLVVTNRPYEGEVVWYDSLAEYAKNHDISYYEIESLSDVQLNALVEDSQPDILFSIAFRQMIPTEVLSIPPKGSINLHDSLLPRYRGFTPSTWVIINGEQETGVVNGGAKSVQKAE